MVALVAITSIAGSFFLLGQNQIMFDELTDEEKGQISYSTMVESIWYVWFLVLG